jgi:hypothetical protein
LEGKIKAIPVSPPPAKASQAQLSDYDRRIIFFIKRKSNLKNG